MRIMIGVSRRRASSSNIDEPAASAGHSLLICIATGLFAVAIDAAFHLPLKLPGHHGLTQMAFLIMAQCVTRRPWAATASAAASAGVAAIPALGFSPLAPWLYLLSGLVIDGLCSAAGAWRAHVWFWGLAGGLGNAAKAIGLWLLGDVASSHGILLVNGLAYSLLSHLAFGCAGGLIMAQLWFSARKPRRPDR
jgi:hypothetical protein